MRSDAKNLGALDAALKHHNTTCPYPPTGIWMNPYEVERLGWDEYKGVPIKGDEKMQTGRFRVTCGGGEDAPAEEETVEAVAEDRDLVMA